MRQIAAALDAAHEVGVMHRDVKPENILITRDDFAYLVDFGLATAASEERLTQMGTMVGTFSYMAPERFRNKEVTSMLRHLLVRLRAAPVPYRPPPYKAAPSSLITAHLTGPIPRPSQIRPGVPAGLDQVIARGMAKRPEDRYATAGDLGVAALDALTATEKRRAANILERGEDATQPTGPAVHRRTPQSYQPPTTQPPTPTGRAVVGTGGRTVDDSTAAVPSRCVDLGQWTGPQAPRSGRAGGNRTWLIAGGAVAAVVVIVVDRVVA